MNHYYPKGVIKGWIGGYNENAAFMVPQAEWFDFWELAETSGRYQEEKPFRCSDCDEPAAAIAMMGEDYSLCESCFESGWYFRLTAAGYMDRTDWMGPFPSIFRAVREGCRFYEVDLDGNTWE